MLQKLKKLAYFPIASYFAFFAQIQLKLWRPRIIVVTGSSGKTTLLHLLESQLGEKARYSHKANSSFGVPFDILDLHRKDLTLLEWPAVFLLAPIRAFKKPFKEKMYVVEADCDRPHEGKFLSSLLCPEIVIWLSSGRTHAMNFDEQSNREKKSVESIIAYEFGYFIENCTRHAIVNGDNKNIIDQLSRTNTSVTKVSMTQLSAFGLNIGNTTFKVPGVSYAVPALLPKEAFYSIAATHALLSDLNMPFDYSFSKLTLPPGRSSLFKGVKKTTLIDSSYNANLDSMTAIVTLFAKYPGEEKWMVLGDMLEQGIGEQQEHEKLAHLAILPKAKKIILMGPRVSKYTFPIVHELITKGVELVKFEHPREVLEFLQNNIRGGETILFKGARFLEGVIEHLLEDKGDVTKLCRREKIWDTRRKKWGL